MAIPIGAHVVALAFAFTGMLAGPAAAQDGATTVILVRHAEKVDESQDPALSLEGQHRAAELTRVLADVRFDAVLSTPFARTRETARRVAEHVGIPLTETPVSRTLGADIAELILREHRGETVLVVGHSNTTPSVIEALGVVEAPPIALDEYDDLFIVTVATDGTATIAHLHYGAPTP